MSGPNEAGALRVRVVARGNVYVGGGSQPFGAGEELDVPEHHVDELTRAGHIETPASRAHRIEAEKSVAPGAPLGTTASEQQAQAGHAEHPPG